MPNFQTSAVTDGTRVSPRDEHGKVRVAYAKYVVGGAALAANDTIELFDLPRGNIRVLTNLSRVRTTALGASRTLDIGHRAYRSRPDNAGSDGAVAEDVDAFVDGLDVSSAVANTVFSLGFEQSYYSTEGIRVFATVLGGTFPAAGELEVAIYYVSE